MTNIQPANPIIWHNPNMLDSGFTTVIGAFILVLGLGYLLRQRNVFSSRDTATLNKVLFNLALPALIIEAVLASDVSAKHLSVSLVAFLTTAFLFLFTWIVGMLFRWEKPTLGSFMLTASLGNTAFMGFPLILAVYGKEQLVWAIFYDYAIGLTMLSIGALLARHYGKEQAERSPRRLISLPSLLTLPIAILLRDVPLPQPLLLAVEFLANATIPLVMLSIAFSLEVTMSKSIGPVSTATLIKLAVAPLIAGLFGSLIGLSGAPLEISMLQAAMPTAMIAVILSVEYGLNKNLASAAIIFSILLSLLSLPFVKKLAVLFQ